MAETSGGHAEGSDVAGRDGLFNDEHWQDIANRLNLSNRQEQICRCLTCGMSDQQIAGDLDIAVGTVRTHLSRLYDKLDTQDRVETVVRVFGAFMAECRKDGYSRFRAARSQQRMLRILLPLTALRGPAEHEERKH